MNKTDLLESIQEKFGISKEELLVLLTKRAEQKRKKKEIDSISIE